MKNQEIYETITELLKHQENPEMIKSRLRELHPYDFASVFSDLTQEERKIIYALLPSDELALLFSYLDEEDSALFLGELKAEKSAAILENMDVDDATDILQELKSSEQKEYLKLLNEDTKKELSTLASYTEDEAGSIMTTNFIQIASNIDVKEAMRIVVRDADESEVIDPIFVQENGILTGLLNLKDLIIARSPKTIKDIMETNFVYVNATDNAVNAVHTLRQYGLTALPVVADKKMIGIITIDDALDVAGENISSHFEHLTATESIEVTDFFKVLSHRIPWLIVLLVLSIATSAVIGNFEGILQQATILIFFQSQILDMAGNVGTQSLAVAIQKLVRHNDLSRQEIRKHIGKEIRISFINSFLIGIFSFLVCAVFLMARHADIQIVRSSLIVSLSMFFSLLIAGILGSSLPILFHKLHIDPGVASGPFITTFNDILSLLIYFMIAAELLF